MAQNSANNLVNMLQQWFDKAPALPPNVREVLVKIAPVISIIFGILGILGALAGLGILTVFSPLAVFGGASGIASYGTGFITALFWLASSVLLLASFPGLQARKISGWNLLFWSEVVSFVGSVIGLAIVSAIIGALVGFYILFQIKSYYK